MQFGKYYPLKYDTELAQQEHRCVPGRDTAQPERAALSCSGPIGEVKEYMTVFDWHY